MGISYYKFRLEELPVVAELLLHQFDRDRDMFEAFSADFNDEYVTKVRQQIKNVSELRPVPVLVAERKNITSQLYQAIDDIIPKLDIIEAYAQRADAGLNMHASMFGVLEAKRELRKKNVEGAVHKIKAVEQNIVKNLDALKEKGYKNEYGIEIKEMAQKIYGLNLLQEWKLSEKKHLVADNHKEYKALWDLIVEISKIGKLVMKLDKSKADDYKFCKLLKRVRKPASVNQDKNEEAVEKREDELV